MNAQIKEEEGSSSSSSSPAKDAAQRIFVPTKAPGIIARLTHNMVANVRSLEFQRHKVANGAHGYVYTARNSGPSSDKVVRLGREESSEDEGCDYAIAVVNRRTKRVDSMPTKLICFENVTSEDFADVLAGRYEANLDYSVDNTTSRDTWAEKRRALTNEFGSAKKVKVQDVARRRQIKDETLSVMNSVFSSTNVKKEEEADEKADISMLTKPESSVLPKANMEAKVPRDVYKLSDFLSDAEVITFKSAAVDKLDGSRKELIERGFSALVCNLISDSDASSERACHLLLLDAMVHCYKILAKRRCLSETEWTQLQYPVTVLSKIREMFFSGEFAKDSAKSKRRTLSVNTIDKDRLLAHILCLALILNYETMSLPITPWSRELGTSEPKIAKMVTALGCSVSAATTAEGIRLGTARMARLVGPPQQPKRRFPGRAGGGRRR